MKHNPSNVLLSRPALALYILLAHCELIYHLSFDYEPSPLSSLYCTTSEVAAVEGVDPTDNVVRAEARRVSCAIVSRAATTYVYVRYGEGAPLYDALDVALVYHGADPTLSWLPSYRLRITVVGPMEIDKQLTYVQGIPIEYAFDQSRAP